MSLRNLFRRQTEAPTLRDRAADLRASLPASRPQHAPATVADSTTAAMQEPVATADPIFGAIAKHVAARATFEKVAPGIDRVARQQQGLDISDEAMASARAAWDAANENEVTTWNALFDARPTTLAGVLAVIRHTRKWSSGNSEVTGALTLEDVFDAIAEGLAGVMRAEATSEKLVRDILDGWAAWGPGVNEVDDSAEGIAAWEHNDANRDRLLHAAMALPATRENIAPKALACAWMERACTERPGQPRDAYGSADQLVWDIHAAIMRQDVEGGADATTDLAAACDQAILDWRAIQPKSRAENWGEAQLDEALDAYSAVFKRAIRQPSSTLSETQAKARLLLHDLREHEGKDEGEEHDDKRLIRVVLREVGDLTDAARPSVSSSDLTSLVDISAATMRELQAIHDMTNEVSTMAHAFVSSGRGMAEGGRGGRNEQLTPAGNFMLWVAEALNAVEDAAYNEIKRRQPANLRDQETRLKVLARPLIENGYLDETAAFARELLAFAEAERRRG